MPYIIILALIGALACWYDSAACHNKWELSSLQSRWGITTQCLVEVKPGVWLPEAAVREIDVLDHRKVSK
jgi:hypothetical protein